MLTIIPPIQIKNYYIIQTLVVNKEDAMPSKISFYCIFVTRRQKLRQILDSMGNYVYMYYNYLRKPIYTFERNRCSLPLS
jgi:hypothetical protein